MNLLLMLVLAAQADFRGGMVRGQLAGRTGRDLTIRLADQRELRCAFGPKTWFERDTQRIEPDAIQPGDRLEILADKQEGGCFARSVHVLDNIPVKTSPGKRPSLKREYTSPTESFAPRGEMTLTGIVLELSEEQITLRTRSKGNQTLLLRHDTRYMSEGLRQARASLNPGTQVFLRAGRNLEGQVEAYSIIWGEILKP